MFKLLVFISALSVSFGKFQTGTITIGGGEDNQWRYLSKFAYQVGTGKWSVRFKTIRPHVLRPTPLVADVYLDNDWEEVDSRDACSRSSLRRTTGTVDIPTNGEWSKWITGNLAQSIRPHVWYFAAVDCKNNFNVPTKIRFELTATQANGSKFSAEVSGVLGILLVEMFVYGVFSFFFLRACLKFYRSNDGLHPVIWTLAAAVVLHALGIFCEFLHLWDYSSDGQGLKALNVLGQMSEILSQVVLSSLLILIALGYTLLHSTIGNLDIVIPIVFIVGIVHLLLVGFGKIKDDASYKFSENEGIVGWLLVGLRVVLLAWFLWATHETKKGAGMQLLHFLRKFEFAGALYFLAFPATMLLTGFFFPPYSRHRAVVVGLFAMTLCGYLWLSKLFLGRGQYFKVSTLSSSFLPGGLKTGADKEE